MMSPDDTKLDAALEKKAKIFALYAHRDQLYGKDPYYVHLGAVVNIVAWNSPNHAHLGHAMRSAAWLHDSIEDTKTTLETINELFGSTVATIVDACTDGPGNTRGERKRHAYEKLAAADWCARRVKLADRIANMCATLNGNDFKRRNQYRQEFPNFMKVCGNDRMNHDLVIRATQIGQII